MSIVKTVHERITLQFNIFIRTAVHAMRLYSILLIKAGRDAMFASQIIFMYVRLPLLVAKVSFKAE